MPERTASVTIGETELALLVDAITREMGHLEERRRAARDRVDRDEWAGCEVKRRALWSLRGRLRGLQRTWGELSQDAREDFAWRVSRIRHKLPRSATNAALLRYERAPE